MQPGDRIAGRFEIEAIAGSGGMGIVFRAHDRESGQTVALKVIGAIAGDGHDRFEREARLLARLQHPGIVRYVAHGATGPGGAFIAMEWLQGEDLAARLDRAPLTIGESVTLVARAAGALGAAHRLGIVHRDVKPENLFLVGGRPEEVKLLDFGVARPATTSLALTGDGVVLGTPRYMAPEQVHGAAEVDARADVWSLGCVLYECVVGRSPFAADHPLAVMARVLLEEPPPPAGIPPALAALLRRMLDKDAAGRPEDGAAVERELTELPAAPRPASVTPAVALTGDEQRLLSIAVAPAPSGGHGATLDERVVPGPALAALARDHGVDARALADGSLLLWVTGAGQANDQAARAARAALALRRMVSPARPVVLATGRAVATGRLPAGEVGDRAVAMARRPAGRSAVILDELTAGLLPGRFDVRAEGAELVLVAERPDAGAARTLLGRPTRFVGRDKEMRLLLATLQDCVGEPTAEATLVLGPPGAGKSRLLDELVRRVRARHPGLEVLVGRGNPINAASPYGLLADALSGAIGLRSDDDADGRRARIRARIARHLPPPERSRVAEFVGELLGAPFPDDESVPLRAARSDPQLMSDQLRRAFLDLIGAELADHPLLVVFEDLQWGDAATVQLVGAALDRFADRPLMVLALSRPELEAGLRQPWMERGHSVLHLAPLSTAAGRTLVEDALGAAADTAAVARIVEQADGNAFFLEELIRAEAEGRGGALPATLVAVVQARLESLEATTRRVLRAASLCGAKVREGCLTAILGEEPQAFAAASALARLVEQELLERPDPEGPDDGTYAFRHELVREAAYGLLTDEDRALGHRLAASWLEEAGAWDRAEIADHHERGGARAAAASWWLRAAEQALAANDLAAVVRRVERGVGCGAEGELLGRLRLVAAEARSWRLEIDAARADGRTALALLPPGSADFYAAAELLCAVADVGSPDSSELAELLLRTAPGPGQEAAAAKALGYAAMNLLHAGDRELARELGERAREGGARFAPGDPMLGTRLQSLRAADALLVGEIGTFVEAKRAACRAAAAAGDVRRMLHHTVGLAYGMLELGQSGQAAAELRHMLVAAEDLGVPWLAAIARQNLALALGRLGELDEARALAELSAEEYRAGGDRRLEAASRTYLASILRERGELAPAEAEAALAARLAAGAAPGLRPHALATLALIRLDAGDAAGALGPAVEAMAVLRSGATVEEGEGLVRLAHAEALHATGDLEGAGTAITEARDRLLERASRVSDAELRGSFLANVPENARTLELARAWRAP